MVQSYEEKARREFAKRLNQALDNVKDAPKGHGRAAWLAQKMDVSPKGAGKWLNGDAIPEVAKFPQLSKIAHCDGAALLFGDSKQKLHAVADIQTQYITTTDSDPRRDEWISTWDDMHPDERQPVLESIATTRKLFAKLRDGPKAEAGGGIRKKDRKTS